MERDWVSLLPCEWEVSIDTELSLFLNSGLCCRLLGMMDVCDYGSKLWEGCGVQQE